MLNALLGLAYVQNSEGGSDSSYEHGLDEYMVLQPNFWESADASTEFEFYDSILVSDEAVEIIENAFSYDLDLVYTSEDVIQLFDYFYKDYTVVCQIALETFKTSDDDQQAQ